MDIHNKKMLFTQITRRQHYVPQFYLNSWATSGQCWVNREGKIFKTSPRNILLEKDFYKIHKLSKQEKKIRDGMLSTNNKELNNVIKETIFYLDLLTLLDFKQLEPLEVPSFVEYFLGMEILLDGEKISSSDFLKKFEQGNHEALNKMIKEEYKNHRIQNAEDMVTDIENENNSIYKMLLDDDLSFMDNINTENDFFHFLGFMLYRTLQTRDKHIATIQNYIMNKSKNNIEYEYCDARKIYSHFIFGQMHTIIYIFMNTKGIKLSLLKSKGKSFITSDQPAFNMNPTTDKDGNVVQMDFILPISPTKLLFVSNKNKSNSVYEVDDKVVEYLNELITKHSYKHIIGVDESSVNNPPTN